MKSLIGLCSALLTDVGSICSVETARDLETIRSRAQHEGVSFLTICLPDFATDFERSLELGRVDSTLFVGWRKRGCLPAFLQGFTSLVFGKDGRILDAPSVSAVFGVRQVCRVFKKIRLACTNTREKRTFEKYVQTETSFNEYLPVGGERREHFNRVCDLLWQEVFGSEFNTFGLVPKHGPGATAEGISGNAKYLHRGWTERLERSFPITEHYFTSVNHMLDDQCGLHTVAMLPESEELPVRVISVPKTLKGPRIIAIEPVCMQYTQQAVSRWITTKIAKSELVKDSIRFTDQVPNQRRALASSSTGQYATIDLSDASDRVPLSEVRQMLRTQPDLLEAIEACRSRSAKLPNGDIIHLKKFASMGSALCFPIESMYFFSIIVHAILWRQGQAPTRSRLLRAAKRVYIFGDDIIVPKGETDTVIDALTMYNCKVNSTKSFWRGKFRESCGCDAFNGVDVTPIYVREASPSTRRDTAGTVSWVATSNLFHEAGCWHAADYMKNVIERILGKLPVVLGTSPGLGWVSFLGLPDGLRSCRNLHRPMVRTFKVLTKRQKDNLGGYPALLKYFLRSQMVNEIRTPLSGSKEHLRFSARCGTVSRKRHWVPAS